MLTWDDARAFVWMTVIALVLTAGCSLAYARDPDGRYANSPLKPWFDQLKSGKGLCCSDADGTVVKDPDWESQRGHYRVFISAAWLRTQFGPVRTFEDAWYEVPEDAVITEPNRAGRAMVWPVLGPIGLSIRCFMPGSMT